MAAIGDVGDYRDAGEWVDAFALAGASAEALGEVATRERVAANVLLALRACVEGPAHDKAETLLSACRVLMRDRRGIDRLLTTEALNQFLAAAETARVGWSARGEAVKCAINAVYSRPEFVATLVEDGSFIPRVLALAGLQAPAAWLALVWKTLLVACECPAAVEMLAQSLDTWQLLHSTICYAAYAPRQQGNSDEVLVEMLKLVAVLVNQLNWSDSDKPASAAVLDTVHQLGGLLLFVLDSDLSIFVKNRVAEVFMVLPPSLTAAFVDEQRKMSAGNPLESVLNHLETMLVAVRVEKTRPIEDMLPVLILCHNLTLAGSPLTVAAFFRSAILPPEPPTPISRQSKRAVFLFTHLQFFLTCLDTDVKRFAGEWLYLLCDQNAEEYTRRTGIGKAIGMLRVKGLA